MKIGDRVELLERFFMLNNKIYEIGHRFKIVGSDDIRGFDLKDDDGNELSETRFLKFRLDKSVERDKKIKRILK